MRARSTLLIVFLAAVFVLAPVSHGFAAQTAPEQQPGYQQTQQNQPGNNSNFSNDLANSANPQMNETPNAAGSFSWGSLLLGAVIGFAIGAVTMGPRRRYTAVDIRRDRAA